MLVCIIANIVDRLLYYVLFTHFLYIQRRERYCFCFLVLVSHCFTFLDENLNANSWFQITRVIKIGAETNIFFIFAARPLIQFRISCCARTNFVIDFFVHKFDSYYIGNSILILNGGMKNCCSFDGIQISPAILFFRHNKKVVCFQDPPKMWAPN